MVITPSHHSNANANTEWGRIDAEFRSIITATFACMASGDISTTEAGDTFISLLRVHLQRFGILKQPKQGEATSMIKIKIKIKKENGKSY